MSPLINPNQPSLEDDTLERRVALFRQIYPWAEKFERRVIAEIMFAVDYNTHYAHGTNGHLAYKTIAALMSVLSGSK